MTLQETNLFQINNFNKNSKNQLQNLKAEKLI